VQSAWRQFEVKTAIALWSLTSAWLGQLHPGGQGITDDQAAWASIDDQHLRAASTATRMSKVAL